MAFPGTGADAAEFADFSRAVRVALDPSALPHGPSAEATRAEASAYLLRLKALPQAWGFCVELLRRSPEAFDAFETYWACQTLVEMMQAQGDLYMARPNEEKLLLEQTLTAWMATVCPRVPADAQTFVLNKFAQLTVVALQLSGYPGRWQSFFSDLFGLLDRGDEMLILWLKILDAIDDCVVKNLHRYESSPQQRERDTLIKDTMRVTCIPQITNTWYHILTRHHETRPDICDKCLKTMGPYFSWIDIGLVSTEDWVNMLYHFVNNSQPLREGALACLTDLCEKKIADSGTKLQLLHSLKATDAMPIMVRKIIQDHADVLKFNADDAAYNGGDEHGFTDETTGVLPRVTHLCQVVCLELINLIPGLIAVKKEGGAAAGSDTLEEALSMLNKCLPMIFELLSCGHAPTSLNLTKYSIRPYVVLLLRHPPDVLSREYLPCLLELCLRRVEYPHDFDFSRQSDTESTVSLLRQQLLIVIKNISSAEPDLVVRTLSDRIQYMVTATREEGSTLSWPPTEATLRCLYTFGEELGTSRAALLKQSDSPFCQMMTSLLSSRVPEAAPHEGVALALLDVVERFYQYFVHTAGSCPLLLKLSLGASGAQHPAYSVRSKACTTFSQLSKLVKPVLIPSLEQIAFTVQQLLATVDAFSVADRCALYETIGILIAPGQNEQVVQSHAHLNVVRQPLTTYLHGVASRPADPAIAQEVANTISFLAFLSKGFSGLASPTLGRIPGEVAAVWRECSGVVVEVTRCYAAEPVVREKGLLFMHRMIDLLGKPVCVYVLPVMEAAMVFAQVSDLPKVVRIPTQLLQRLRGSAVADVDLFFASLLRKVLEATSTEWLRRPDITQSEQAREHLDLLKAYFGLLTQAAQPECVHIFMTERSAPMLNTVLETLKQGCLTDPKTGDIAKCCYQVLGKLAHSWYSTADFSNYLATKALPLTVETQKQPHYNPKDACCDSVAGEIASLYLFLHKAAGPEAFSQALNAAWGGLPQEHVAQMMYTLQNGEMKPVKLLLRQWAVALKQAQQAQ